MRNFISWRRGGTSTHGRRSLAERLPRLRHIMVTAVAGGALVVFAAPPAGASKAPKAPASNWVELHPATTPPSVTNATMTYDPATKQLVLFGGYHHDPTDTTWVWTGSDWSQLHPATSPSPRRNAAMAYDAQTKQIILYGGSGKNQNDLGDTWAWNGTTWQELHPEHSPGGLSGSLMDYDGQHNQLVLYGGINDSVPQGATWTFNGTDWNKTNAESPRQNGGEMTYDAANKELVLFGSVGEVINTWNGTDWVDHHPPGHPYGRSNGVMSFDPQIGQVVLVTGGNSDHPFQDDTWTWNGTTWDRLDTAANPPPRWHAVMDYDGDTNQLVLFSGFDKDYKDLSDTWTLRVTAASSGSSKAG
jgi:hypothetical protein